MRNLWTAADRTGRGRAGEREFAGCCRDGTAGRSRAVNKRDGIIEAGGGSVSGRRSGCRSGTDEQFVRCVLLQDAHPDRRTRGGTPRKRRQDPFQGGTGDSRDSREDDIIGRFQPSVVVPGEKRRVQTVPGREDVWELFHVHGVVDVQVHFLWRENLEGGRLRKPCDSSRLLCGGGRRQSSGMRG